MIFCHTRKTASWLVEKMMAEGHAVALLSGELSIEQRIQVLDRFRDGLEKILITTNVLSRGIDVEQVTFSETAERRPSSKTFFLSLPSFAFDPLRGISSV